MKKLFVFIKQHAIAVCIVSFLLTFTALSLVDTFVYGHGIKNNPNLNPLVVGGGTGGTGSGHFESGIVGGDVTGGDCEGTDCEEEEEEEEGYETFIVNPAVVCYMVVIDPKTGKPAVDADGKNIMLKGSLSDCRPGKNENCFSGCTAFNNK